MPRHRRIGHLTSIAALTVALVSACGFSGPDASTPTTAATTQQGGEPGRVDVMAAASLTNVVKTGAAALEVQDDAWHVSPKVAGSQDLVRQIQEGDDADVVALADTKNMKVLQDADLVEDPVIFATNTLMIAVQPGNPKGIERLEDLADADLQVVLADPSVPAGKYAAQALEAADVDVRPASLELDVRSTLAKVSERVADAAIVYVTDVKAKDDEVDGVEIPVDRNVEASYPVAVLKDAAHPDAARAFVESLVSGALHDALVAAGFGTP